MKNLIVYSHTHWTSATSLKLKICPLLPPCPGKLPQEKLFLSDYNSWSSLILNLLYILKLEKFILPESRKDPKNPAVGGGYYYFYYYSSLLLPLFGTAVRKRSKDLKMMDLIKMIKEINNINKWLMFKISERIYLLWTKKK